MGIIINNLGFKDLTDKLEKSRVSFNRYILIFVILFVLIAAGRYLYLHTGPIVSLGSSNLTQPAADTVKMKKPANNTSTTASHYIKKRIRAVTCLIY